MKKFDYNWTLKDANFTKDQGSVFSCFSCGGGSTMGYKLAGFDVIGCNEIDPKMMEIYQLNHNPKFPFLEAIQDFKKRDDLPDELYNLDILDGSPPCSSFSMAGARERDWGKEKKFREGQAEQVLDTLFFDFIDLAEKLKPRVVIAENVKGLMLGDAIAYVDRILKAFDAAGYYVDFKLVSGANMGLPQKRERVFFYAARKDLYVGQFNDLFMTQPILDLDFNEPPITYGEIKTGKLGKELQGSVLETWEQRQPGDVDFGTIRERITGKRTQFGRKFIFDDKVPLTLTANPTGHHIRFDVPHLICDEELMMIGSFPQDYQFKEKNLCYFIGMSVPPIMTAQIAQRVNDQWLKLNVKKS